MALKHMMGYIGKREFAAWGVLAATFVGLIALHLPVWVFLAVAAVFIGYVSWNSSAFFVTQGTMSRQTITAWAWPVGLATFQAGCGLGVAWLVFWLGRRLLGH
jgi:hypothetical protein